MTVIMPGHEPMLGTVRWVAGTRFGIQTDREIETMRLRAAHKDQIVAADSKADFQIIPPPRVDRSEEHTSELQSLMRISYAVFCLKQKKTIQTALQSTI